MYKFWVMQELGKPWLQIAVGNLGDLDILFHCVTKVTVLRNPLGLEIVCRFLGAAILGGVCKD